MVCLTSQEVVNKLVTRLLTPFDDGKPGYISKYMYTLGTVAIEFDCYPVEFALLEYLGPNESRVAKETVLRLAS